MLCLFIYLFFSQHIGTVLLKSKSLVTGTISLYINEDSEEQVYECQDAIFTCNKNYNNRISVKKCFFFFLMVQKKLRSSIYMSSTQAQWSALSFKTIFYFILWGHKKRQKGFYETREFKLAQKFVSSLKTYADSLISPSTY